MAISNLNQCGMHNLKILLTATLLLVVSGCSVNKQMQRSIENVELKNEDGIKKKGRKLVFTSTLHRSAREAFIAYSNPSVLLQVSKPQAILKPIRHNEIPMYWPLGKGQAFRFTMNGFIPFGKHHITYESIDSTNLSMQTREHGVGVPVWDNFTEFIPISDSTCTLREELVISAGALNAYVVAYAIDLFEGRHKRLKEYLRNTR